VITNVDVVTSAQNFLLLVEEVKLVEVDLRVVWECSLLFAVFMSVEYSRLDVVFLKLLLDVMIHNFFILSCGFGVSPLHVINVILNIFKGLSQVLGNVKLLLDANLPVVFNVGCCDGPLSLRRMKMNFVNNFP
jgi:hypothetical protein